VQFETLLIDKKDEVAVITLNRPAKRNAMNPQLHRDMTAALDQLRDDPGTKVLVITGAGDVFCAGMDLKEFFVALKDKPAEYEAVWKLAVEWRSRTLRYYPKPVIGMINGYCFGGAFAIVEGCDLAFAAEDATFGLSEINFKLFPGGSVSKALANLLRPRDALYYGMTGDTFDGAEAARIGFINKAFPRAQLVEQTLAIARKIAAKDGHALRATKEGYRYSLEMTWDAAMNFAMAKELELVQRQNDAWRKEGIGDFLQGKYRPGLESHPG
jgi:feruloyl-CoA hydratase/lyase